MGILNSEQAQYQEYAKGVRKEYLPVVGEGYNEKRVEFLEGIKGKEMHFSHPTPRIIPNIEGEIKALKGKEV